MPMASRTSALPVRFVIRDCHASPPGCPCAGEMNISPVEILSSSARRRPCRNSRAARRPFHDPRRPGSSAWGRRRPPRHAAKSAAVSPRCAHGARNPALRSSPRRRPAIHAPPRHFPGLRGTVGNGWGEIAQPMEDVVFIVWLSGLLGQGQRGVQSLLPVAIKFWRPAEYPGPCQGLFGLAKSNAGKTRSRTLGRQFLQSRQTGLPLRDRPWQRIQRKGSCHES